MLKHLQEKQMSRNFVHMSNEKKKTKAFDMKIWSVNHHRDNIKRIDQNTECESQYARKISPQ